MAHVTLPSSRPARPPWRDFGHLHRLFGSDILSGLTHVHRRYGDFVRTRLPLQLYFVADPQVIEEILVKKAEWFSKDRTSRLLSRVIGNGLLVNEGESWRRQRRLLQPAFHHQQLQSYASLMVEAIERAAAGWHAGEVRNVHEDMMGVTMRIVAGTLFGADVSTSASDLGRVISTLIAAGEPAEVMYVIKTGDVDIVKNGRTIETVAADGFFGELALVDSQSRSAGAVAKTDCTLARVTEKQFLFMVGETPFFALYVMREMARRLRRTE